MNSCYALFDKISKKIIDKMEAKIFDYKIIGSESLLLALMEIDNSILKYLLKDYGVSLEKIKAEISKFCLLRKSRAHLNYTTKLQEILNSAKQIAKLEETKFIYSEYLIYALLNTNSSTAKDILEALGVDTLDLLDDLNNIYSIDANTDLIDNYLTNLSKLAKLGKLNPFVGKEGLINKLIRILSKRNKNNPMLIGSAGVGKSALVEGLTNKLLALDATLNIYRLDLGIIIAGTKYRGDLEERLISVIEKIKNPFSIIFIDEVHNIVGSGSSEGSLDIANILKPILARSEIKCIGATTLDEYYKFIEKDKALSRRFQNIFVEEASIGESVEILIGIKDHYEDFHQVKYSNNVINYLVSQSKLITNRKLPDKAIDILDEAGIITKNEDRINVSRSDVDKIIFESLGLDYPEILDKLKLDLNYSVLKKYFKKYFLNLGINKTICNLQIADLSLELLLEDINSVFNFRDEVILKLDFTLMQDSYNLSSLIGSPAGYVGYDAGGKLTEHVIKYPLSVVIIRNSDNANERIKSFINSILEVGYTIDAKGRNISFRNTIFIFVEVERERTIGYIKNSESSPKLNPYINEILGHRNNSKYYLLRLDELLKKLAEHEYYLSYESKDLDYKTYHMIVEEIDKFEMFKEGENYIISHQDTQVIINPRKVEAKIM